jgi:hypothetical protein
MILIGLFGLIISALSYLVAFPSKSRRKPALFLALLSLHVATAVLYWYLIGQWGGDANVYYTDAHGEYRRPIEPGSNFVVHVVQHIKNLAGGTKLDFYILFQSFGLLGLAFLLRSFEEVSQDIGKALPKYAYAVLFLPGIHFWTSAIGKDPLAFLGIAIVLWCSLHIERRLIFAALGLAIIVAVRPHIAALAGLALVAAVTFDIRMRLAARILLGAASAICLVVLAQIMRDDLGLDNLQADTLGEYIDTRTQIGSRFEGGADILDLPYFMRVLSFLFRPLFVDATGAVGYAASAENVVLVAMFIYVLYHGKTVVRLASSVFALRFALIFGTTVIGLLSLVNYNVGLGLRQKFMAMPAVLLIFGALVTYRLVTLERSSDLPSRRLVADDR